MHDPMKKLCSFLIIWLFSVSSLQAQPVYFVDARYGSDNNTGTSAGDAFKTLTKARDRVRLMNDQMTGDITVYLREGVYELDSTLVFTRQDGGTHGHQVIYQAYRCEKPVISGGDRIRGWSLYNSQKNIYRAFAGTSVQTRQIYINGKRGIRARSVDAAGWTEKGNGYDCPATVKDWHHVLNVEVVSYNQWKCHRGPVASVEKTHAKMSEPYWDNVHKQFDAPPAWIENALELLDSEGEWYLDFPVDSLYYKPRVQEDLSNAEVILPTLQTLMKCSDVSHIRFNGLTFAYATWLYPNSRNGFACVQADLIDNGNTQVPGNIILERCSDIGINSCTFEHLGGSGLQLYDGCKNNVVYNCMFTDISGSATSIGNVRKPFPDSADLLRDNLLINNYISDAAHDFKGCVGIFAGYTQHTVISHNELRNLPYTGISLGWGWSNRETVAKNNEISFNLIDSVVTVLEDGGAIYTLSTQPGTTVHDNYIKNQLHMFGALYPDEGSSYMNWYHNVARDVPAWLHMWTPSIQWDTIENNYHNNTAENLKGSNCTIRNNVLVNSANWPARARAIMKNAGRIKSKECIPVYHGK